MIRASYLTRPRVYLVATGLGLSLAAIFLHTLGTMAHAHGAVSHTQQVALSWALIVLEWPVLLLDRPLLHSGYMYYHSHVQGSGFWEALAISFVVNGLGWTALFLGVETLGRRAVGRSRGHHAAAEEG